MGRQRSVLPLSLSVLNETVVSWICEGTRLGFLDTIVRCIRTCIRVHVGVLWPSTGHGRVFTLLPPTLAVCLILDTKSSSTRFPMTCDNILLEIEHSSSHVWLVDRSLGTVH